MAHKDATLCSGRSSAPRILLLSCSNSGNNSSSRTDTYYSPSIGRFLQADPIGYIAGMNLYAYVGNDPTNFKDASGLEELPANFYGPVNYLKGDTRSEIPLAPPGANVLENAALAAEHGFWSNGNPAGDPFWFREAVRNNVRNDKDPSVPDWDYKQQSTPTQNYQDFGNFNFGVTGAAFGFSLNTLQRTAGKAQIEAGTSDPSFGNPGTFVNGIPMPGPNPGKAPYGDDPRDQYWIQKGYEYYQRRIQRRSCS